MAAMLRTLKVTTSRPEESAGPLPPKALVVAAHLVASPDPCATAAKQLDAIGEGIPHEEQDAIFEPFQRGANSNGDGIGIGLALARQTVEQHGGRVWVYAATGSGSTFWVKMPAQPPLRGEG